jgi:hypothetical protein
MTIWVGATFCLVFLLWAYTRDSNNLSGIFTVALFGGTLLFQKYRDLKFLRFMTVFLACITLVGIITSMQSTRAATPMRNVYDVHVLPFASRIEFMKSFGMPEPFSAEYAEWAEEHAAKAYLAFLLTHPRYMIIRYFEGAQEAFIDYTQPYFRTPGNDWRERLIGIGQAINMGFVVCFIDVLLIVTFWSLAFRGGFEPAEPWTWLATWLLLTAASTLFFSVIGDNIGLNRHALLPVAAFRLFFWIFFIVALDLLLLKRSEAIPASGAE